MVANPYLYATMLFLLFHFCTLMVNYALLKNVGKFLTICHHALPPLSPLQSYDELSTVKNVGKSLSTYMLTMLFLLFHLCTLMVNYAL
jgi:hypothetical protein